MSKNPSPSPAPKDAKDTPAPQSPDQPSRKPTVKDALTRAFSARNVKATGDVLKSAGNFAIGMHPLWLMGEAVTGKKVGSHARKGQKELIAASEAFREMLSTSTSDIIVIIDEQLRSKGKETVETADVLKTAGEHAIVIVSSSIEKAREQMERNSPAVKKSILKNGRQVVVIADSTLKNPVVITGVSKFARSKGIPYPEAILQVASLALSKILAAIPEEVEEIREAVEEIDAEELERRSSKEAEAEMRRVGKEVEEGEKKGGSGSGKGKGKDAPAAAGNGTTDKEKKKDGCVIA